MTTARRSLLALRQGTRPAARVVMVLALVVLGVDLVVLATGAAHTRTTEAALPAASPTTLEPTTTTETVTTTVPPTTAAPTTTTEPPTTTTSTTAPAPAPVPAQGPWTIGPYRGLGVWVDVYDWTHEFTRNGEPRVGPAQIDEMAQVHGLQTLFIQTSHHRSAADVIEPDRLAAIIERAHANGMAVIAWYLPTLEDIELDLRRLLAAASTGVDGLGVDIEARHVDDHVERNARLLELSRQLRGAVGERAISAITPSAVHLQVVNPGFWPEFPWVELAQGYDAILPMAYFSIRKGELRSGERYIAENIDRIRASTGDQEVPIHPIGGIADGATVEDLEGMVRAATSRGVLGASLYDWATSNPAQWAALRPFRKP